MPSVPYYLVWYYSVPVRCGSGTSTTLAPYDAHQYKNTADVRYRIYTMSNCTSTVLPVWVPHSTRTTIVEYHYRTSRKFLVHVACLIFCDASYLPVRTTSTSRSTVVPVPLRSSTNSMYGTNETAVHPVILPAPY